MTQQNADALTKAFAAADTGDASLLVSLYADDMTWAGFTVDGTVRLYTKGEFLEAFGVLAKLDESRNEVIGCAVVGDEIVTANVRIYRRLGGVELDTTMVMVHRFIDGQVTFGNDMVPSSFEQFWAAAGITG
ncbi:nuclear transport factor 2 family protein [Gordonia pseudamarae]|jgi:ketosteroid isomerase-like protein|uniref:Nuclear transport factor 2 family protein n=1 Tax=Gordonia pseudamarae TaxID=2831662 RepID=A0ABX6IEF6_9ACTN|nr:MULTISPECIES: nuclear transport factor 2 family protein [Gordonia]MBD0021708.1 nuclear transport factor 2 family protein [Gordonia sp. (in: high G+C Gram-positive bacteria)]QHN25316.1 nuclear transport factor 2 family protein [Gordonia pseudamarae]QHN34248.1 nuclear transport factor 2 family protein [Gordonia pseudamarae]